MFKIKLELWLRTIIGYLVILVALFTWAFLQDKIINTLLILMAYLSTRWVFPTTYHANTNIGCITFTIACFCIAITVSLPMNLSIIASVLVGAVISLILFVMQLLIDLLTEKQRLQKELDKALIEIQEYERVDFFQMTEEQLRQYGASKGLSEIQQDILIHRIIDHYTIAEIVKYRNYGRSTIKYHINEIKRKLDIEKI